MGLKCEHIPGRNSQQRAWWRQWDTAAIRLNEKARAALHGLIRESANYGVSNNDDGLLVSSRSGKLRVLEFRELEGRAMFKTLWCLLRNS